MAFLTDDDCTEVVVENVVDDGYLVAVGEIAPRTVVEATFWLSEDVITASSRQFRTVDVVQNSIGEIGSRSQYDDVR